jgi:hypothetical protein
LGLAAAAECAVVVLEPFRRTSRFFAQPQGLILLRLMRGVAPIVALQL